MPRLDVCLPAEFVILRGKSTHRMDGNRVVPAPPGAGTIVEGKILDVSANGAFIACEKPPPLMSRMMLRFWLESYGKVTGVAWCMWQREQDELLLHPRTVRPAGVGVLFEHIPLAARVAIHDRATKGHLRVVPSRAAG